MKKVLTFCALVITISLCATEPIKGSVGLGLGIPYGFMGMNMDYYLNQYAALTAGVGSTNIAGIGFSVGTKYYFVDDTKSFRPRLTAMAGINGALKKEIFDNEVTGSSEDLIKETFPGVSLGLGALITWGENKQQGLDFDVFYICSSGIYDRISNLRDHGYDIKKPGRISISFGYRYQF